MIVRILGEGQLQVDDSSAEELNGLDAKLEAAVERGDEGDFRSALDALLACLRSIGRPLAPDALAPSELIIPADGATMAEVRKLMTDEGLIPG